MKTQIVVSAAVIGIAAIAGIVAWAVRRNSKSNSSTDNEPKPSVPEVSVGESSTAGSGSGESAGEGEPKPKMRAFKRKMNAFDRSVRLRSKAGANGGESSGPAYKWIQHNLASNDPEAKNTPSARYYFGVHDDIGPRNEMEDAVACKGKLDGKEDQDYFAVFDGHGGRDAATFCMLKLHGMIVEGLKKEKDAVNVNKVLTDCFRQIDSDIGPWAEHLGTTAAVAFILGNKLYSANAGDARLVLAKRDGSASRISKDHKPSDPDEAKRIKELGGTVEDNRVNNRIAVTRAIGDSFMSNLIIPDPYINTVELSADDRFMILACDGLWDVVKDEEAVKIVADILDNPAENGSEGENLADVAAKKLVQIALKKETMDNVSVCVVVFEKKE